MVRQDELNKELDRWHFDMMRVLLFVASGTFAAVSAISFMGVQQNLDVNEGTMTQEFTQAAVYKQMQEWVDIHKPHIAGDVGNEIARGLHWETERDYIVVGKVDMAKVRADVQQSWQDAVSRHDTHQAMTAGMGVLAVAAGAAGLYYRKRLKALELS